MDSSAARLLRGFLEPCLLSLLAEHADPAMVLDLPGGLMPMAEALPFAFGPGDLNAVERTAPFVSKEN